MENFKFRLEMVDLCKDIDGVRYENCELKNMVNEMKVWMRYGKFLKYNDLDVRIKIERGFVFRMLI